MPDFGDLVEDLFDDLFKKGRKKLRKRKKAGKKKKKSGTGGGWLADAWAAATQKGERSAPASADASTEPLADGPSPHARDATLQAYLEQAAAYQRGMAHLLETATNELNRARIEDLHRQVDSWRMVLHDLVERVDRFKQDALIRRDMEMVPNSIARLEKQVTEVTEPRIQHELQRTLKKRRQQWETLEKVQNIMRWAEVKIESTVSLLGTIYSQAVISQTKGKVADFRRLLQDAEEEVLSLRDYLTMLEDVKLGSSHGGVHTGAGTGAQGDKSHGSILDQ
jgi:hypothetical protein